MSCHIYIYTERASAAAEPIRVLRAPPRSCRKSGGIWGGILDKMFKLGQEKPHADVNQIMYVLENLERIYLIEVITGPTWETIWTKYDV